MKAKTVLFVISLLVLVLGVLPFVKQYISAVIPVSGTIYQAALIVLGLIGIIASFNKRL